MAELIEWTIAERWWPECSAMWDVQGFDWTPRLMVDVLTVRDTSGWEYVKDESPYLYAIHPSCQNWGLCECQIWDVTVRPGVQHEWKSWRWHNVRSINVDQLVKKIREEVGPQANLEMWEGLLKDLLTSRVPR